MTNPDDLDQHWRTIAEQLGLEPEPSAASPPCTEEHAHSPRPREALVRQRPVAEPSGRERRDRPLSDEPEEASADSLALSETAVSVTRPIVEAVKPDETPDATGSVESAPADEEAPRGGRSRRRRRRRSKSGKETAADAPGEEDASGAPPRGTRRREDSTADSDRGEVARGQESEEDAPRGRSRRRGQRKRGSAASAAEGRPESEQDAPPKAPAKEDAPVAEELADEDEDLSKWEVPSWQELIASLYRPER
jgi:ribonuclease E